MANMFRSSNPTFKPNTFENSRAILGQEVMTLQGTINKTGILLVLAIGAAAWTWNMARSESPEAVLPWMMGGVIGGFILAMVTVFKKQWSPVTAPLYALLEGLALGGISSFLEAAYPGIAIQAVGLTFATLFAMLFLYTSGVLRATRKFVMGVMAATGAIFLVYMVSFVMGFFGRSVPLLNDSGPWGIAISGFIVVVAALNLILNFDFIERGAQAGAAKYMEWYGAFGLMVTLVWLYLEILRLLEKTRRR
jgi:uncharacterized YccA/Bax inhibitor family protein